MIQEDDALRLGRIWEHLQPWRSGIRLGSKGDRHRIEAAGEERGALSIPHFQTVGAFTGGVGGADRPGIHVGLTQLPRVRMPIHDAGDQQVVLFLRCAAGENLGCRAGAANRVIKLLIEVGVEPLGGTVGHEIPGAGGIVDLLRDRVKAEFQDATVRVGEARVNIVWIATRRMEKAEVVPQFVRHRIPNPADTD